MLTRPASAPTLCGWSDATRLLVGYVGPAGGADAVGPALRSLRASGTEVVLLLPAGASPRESEGLCIRYEPGSVADPTSLAHLTHAMSECDIHGALILAHPGHTPFDLAYICYLAGVPRRAALADEFGGGVLSDPVARPADLPAPELHLHLLHALGLARREPVPVLTVEPAETDR